MRHPLHSLCPYFAMFPEQFVAKQVFAYTKRGETVFDPFCGRGTSVFESLLHGRQAGGVDINPVAACIAGAKADAPTIDAVMVRLRELEEQQIRSSPQAVPASDFFKACFHPQTLQQLLFLRTEIAWRQRRVDRFIAAVILGCLHGESHKSENCLSNRMPRTISTKPDYSVRWWSENGYVAPERDAFAVLRRLVAFRLSQKIAPLRGHVRLRDARTAARGFPKLRESVRLVVTSPPYLDTTDFAEDQWLRLWFLGGPERPLRMRNRDDRHTSIASYWKFLSEAWAGCAELVKQGTTLVIRIGGTHLARIDLLAGLQTSLEIGFSGYRVTPYSKRFNTTEIKNRQTNVFRPGTSPLRYEHDFVFGLR